MFNTITNVIDQATLISFEIVKTIATNPSAVKKVGQLTTNSIEIVNKVKEQEYLIELGRHIKGANQLLGFYSSFANIVYWINPFSVDKMDQDKLVTSLEKKLYFRTTDKQEIITQVMQNVLSLKKTTGRKGVIKNIIETLENKGLSKEEVKDVVKEAEITSQSRSVLDMLAKGCYTVTGLGSNLLTLHDWKIIDLADLAIIGAKIGQLPVLREVGKMTVVKVIVAIPLKTGLSIIGIVGTTFSFAEAAKRLTSRQIKIYKINKIKKNALEQDERDNFDVTLKKLKLQRTQAIWDVATTGTDLISSTAPLVLAPIVTVNPLVFLGLAMVAQGVGLTAILVKALN